MDKYMEQGIKDIKYVMPLTADQEQYITLVLGEIYTYGSRDGLEEGFKICHGKESLTEEQLIEREKVSGVTSSESTIL